MNAIETLKQFERLLEEKASTFLGYPCSMFYEYEPLQGLLKFNIDNVGDPFVDSLYAVNSTRFEREVIAYFCRLYEAPLDKSWGYVTSSGSEGNLYGLYLGREAYPEGILYYSAHTHYSVPKAARLLKLPERPVPALSNGEIDYDQLEAAILSNPGRPAIINANIGTTMTGAIDNVERIVALLKRNQVEQFYIHCDAALSGMVLPFIKGAPRITFEQPIGSVSVSGHKFLGAPYPCGIVVTRNEHVARIRREVEYVGTTDATIGGSRSGQAPLHLWHAIVTRGADNGFQREVAACLGNAAYVREKLEELGVPTFMNDHSLTVVFEEPSDQLVRKWCLARQNGLVHIIAVPHAQRPMIDAFLSELREARAVGAHASQRRGTADRLERMASTAAGARAAR